LHGKQKKSTFVPALVRRNVSIARRKGNQVKVLNRPATVSPMQHFGNALPLFRLGMGRPPKMGTSQETCQRKNSFKAFEEKALK
jgi:hypothetical protein